MILFAALMVIVACSSNENIQTEKTLEAERIISFSDFGAENFTCTGMTYDTKDDVVWIADYGALTLNGDRHPRVVAVKNFESVVKSLDVDTGSDLQGIAYDEKDDALWLALGDKVIEMDKDGKTVDSLELTFTPNGICYDPDDTLWVLCTEKYLLHLEKSGEIIQSYEFNYRHQDHIYTNGECIYVTIGADYKGDDNYLCKFSEGGDKEFYRLIGANAVEGICKIDGRIYIANDGLYHDDKRGESYIAEFIEG